MVEAEKARLLVGNQENTEAQLKKTSEDGIVRMSIKSLWQKIAVKTERQKEIYFILHKNLPRGTEGTGGGGAAEQEQVFSSIDQTVDQLDVIKTYIQGFDLFCKELNQPIAEVDQQKVQQAGVKGKQTYFQRMKEKLLQMERDGEMIDGIEEFHTD